MTRTSLPAFFSCATIQNRITEAPAAHAPANFYPGTGTNFSPSQKKWLRKPGRTSKKVSFAKVVREAVDAFDSETSADDTKILEALADTMIQTTQEVVKKMEEVEKRLDATHAMLEAQ